MIDKIKKALVTLELAHIEGSISREKIIQLRNVEKSFSLDLQNRFPSGEWKTINGAKVFINNGKVIAGLDDFNGMIDDFFKEKKDSKPKDPEIIKEIKSGRWNGKIYGSERTGYSIYLNGKKRVLSSNEMKQMNDYDKAMKEFKEKRKKDVQNRADNLFKKEKMNRDDLKFMSDNIDIFPDTLRESIRSITKDAPPIGTDVENSKVTGYKMTQGGIFVVLQNGDEVRLRKMKRLKPVEKIGDMSVTKHFDDSISVSFPYDVALKNKVKEAGARWNPGDVTWDFSKDKVKDFYENFGGDKPLNLNEKMQKFLKEVSGKKVDMPYLPESWNHIKKEYAAVIDFNKDGKIQRNFLGSREDFSSSGKNATMSYNKDAIKSMPTGTIIEEKSGSYKNLTKTYYRKDADGWKHLGEIDESAIESDKKEVKENVVDSGFGFKMKNTPSNWNIVKKYGYDAIERVS